MTYVYTSLTVNDIARALRDDKGAGWTYQEALALAEFLLECAEGSGEPIELDVAVMRCDYSSYDSLEAFQAEYGDKYRTMEDVQDATLVIPVEGGGFIIQAF